MHSIEKYSIIRLSIGFKSAAHHLVIMNFHDFLNEKKYVLFDWFWFVCQLVWCLFLILYFKILIYIIDFPQKGAENYPELGLST